MYTCINILLLALLGKKIMVLVYVKYKASSPKESPKMTVKDIKIRTVRNSKIQ